MLQRMKWMMLAAALAAVVSGCSSTVTNENPGAEPPAGTGTETPAETPTPSEQPGDAPAEEPAEPVEEPTAGDVSVETGAAVEIETMIEGMTEKVEVTEYTLMPHDIHYQLRTAMGEPTVEDGKVVYRSQMGDDVATIAIEVQEGVSLGNAVAEVMKQYKGGFEAQEPMDISTEINTYPGKLQSFQKDNYFHGYKVFDIDGDAFVITYSYPVEAGDGMAAVFAEMLKSIKKAK